MCTGFASPTRWPLKSVCLTQAVRGCMFLEQKGMLRQSVHGSYTFRPSRPCSMLLVEGHGPLYLSAGDTLCPELGAAWDRALAICPVQLYDERPLPSPAHPLVALDLSPWLDLVSLLRLSHCSRALRRATGRLPSQVRRLCRRHFPEHAPVSSLDRLLRAFPKNAEDAQRRDLLALWFWGPDRDASRLALLDSGLLVTGPSNILTLVVHNRQGHTLYLSLDELGQCRQELEVKRPDGFDPAEFVFYFTPRHHHRRTVPEARVGWAGELQSLVDQSIRRSDATRLSHMRHTSNPNAITSGRFW